MARELHTMVEMPNKEEEQDLRSSGTFYVMSMLVTPVYLGGYY